MKTAVQTAAIFMMLILVVALTANQFGNTTSNSELESSLDNAMEHALYVALSKNNYTIDSKEMLASDVLHELMATCNVKADYTVSFHEIDRENGLLDMCVTQDVHTSPLVHSKVSCRKTLIFEHGSV